MLLLGSLHAGASGRPSPLFELNVSTIYPADLQHAFISGDNKGAAIAPERSARCYFCQQPGL
jgi:hypothetical protein